jgi:hypothetical protein
MIKVLVEYDERCTHSEREPKQYGSWSEQYSSSITNVRRISDDEDRPYRSDVFAVPEGTDKVYVVYMIYSTGDSFGRREGNIDVIHCTAREDAAHALADKITKNADEYSIEFVDDFDRPIKISNRGAGYFESIDYVSVECYTISTQGKKARYYVK